MRSLNYLSLVLWLLGVGGMVKYITYLLSYVSCFALLCYFSLTLTLTLALTLPETHIFSFSLKSSLELLLFATMLVQSKHVALLIALFGSTGALASSNLKGRAEFVPQIFDRTALPAGGWSLSLGSEPAMPRRWLLHVVTRGAVLLR